MLHFPSHLKKKSLLQYNFTLIRKVENTVYRSAWKKFIHCHVGLFWAGSDNLVSLSAGSWALQFCGSPNGCALLWAQQWEGIWYCRSARACLTLFHIFYKKLLTMRMLNMLLLKMIFLDRWRWEFFMGRSASAAVSPHVDYALAEL